MALKNKKKLKEALCNRRNVAYFSVGLFVGTIMATESLWGSSPQWVPLGGSGPPSQNSSRHACHINNSNNSIEDDNNDNIWLTLK